MPPEEQERRMRRLRQQVTDNNIYRWAGMLLSEAAKLADAHWQEPRGDRQGPHILASRLIEVSS